MRESDSARLEGLERRVERLTSVLIIQSLLLAVVVLWATVTAAPYLTLFGFIAVVVLAIYHRSLPDWFRAVRSLLQRFDRLSPGTRSAKGPHSGEPSSL